MAVAPNFNLEFYLTRERAGLGRKFLRFAVIALMGISIVAPVVRFSEEFWLKLDQIFLVPVALIYLWLLLAGLARPIRVNALFAVALTFCVCIAMSLVYGTQVIGHPLFLADLYELPKTFIPVIFFTLAYEADFSEGTLRTLGVSLFPAILLICVYAYGQWFNMDFTRYLQPYYSGGLHDDGGLAHYRRVYSTLSNPNYLGMLMTWMASIFAMAVLCRVGNRFWNITALLASLTTLAMTGSRYGVIDTGFALLLVLFLSTLTEISKRRRRGILLAGVPLILGAYLAVTMSNRATLDRVQMLGKPLQENSLRMRLDSLWVDALDKFVQSPLLGHGPAKAIFWGVITDSEYLHILKQFGVVGLVPYLCYFLLPLWLVWKGLRHVREAGPWLELQYPATFWAVSVAFILIMTALVMNIGMCTYFNPSLVGFLWMWMGIGARCAGQLRAAPGFHAGLSQS